MSSDDKKKLKKLLLLLERRGFAVADNTGRKHLKYKITAPNGEGLVWVLGATPSDRRAWSNSTQVLRSWLHKCGYRDERHYLQITSSLSTNALADCSEIYDIIDELEQLVA
jgi:hypothetical protein